MESYFSVPKNILGRFFFIFGKTNDCFCDNNLVPYTIEYALNEHLKKEGYRRVIFYSKTQKIHCYDDESFRLRKGSPAQTGAEPKNVKKSPMLLKGPLSGRMAPPAQQAKEPDETGNSLNFGKMDEYRAFEIIDNCMKDKNIKTAVVFTNADDFINYFGEVKTDRSLDDIRNKVFDSLNRYDKLGHENSNIMLFIFPSQASATVYNENGGTVWNTFFKPRLESSAIIHITPPTAGEIRNAINNIRLNHGLQVDFTQLDNMCRNIAKTFYADKPVFNSLDALVMELKKIANKGFVLNEERCDIMLGKHDKETAFQKLEKLIGMGSVKTEIKILEKQADINNRTAQKEDFKSRLMLSAGKGNKAKNVHYVLTGNPGTGKTTAARLLGEILNELGYLERGHTVKVSRDDLVAGYVGQTAIKTKEKINEAMGGVLFIDEAYSLAQGGENDFGQEAINTIVEAMTDRMGQFAVVAAGYPKQMADFLNANPGLSDRFAKVISIEDYNTEELLQIFNMNLKREGYALSEKLIPLVNGFFENWHRFAAGEDNWANARSVEKLLGQMYGNWCLRDGEKSQDMPLLDICDIPADLQIHCKPVSEAKKDAVEKLNNLVGLKRVKERINELRRNIKFGGGVPEPGHYVFAGNPGTGKTTVARLLGDIFCDIGVLRRGDVIEVSREDLVGVHVGETAIKTKKQLEKAMDRILFIDEAYRLYERSDSHNYGKESIDTILPFIENNRNRICVICAGYTAQMGNFIKSNEGLKSRFTETIIFDDYNTDELLQILNSFSEAEGLILEKEYMEKSRVVFDFWIANKGPDFGNARYVRSYVRECKNALYRRLEDEFQNLDTIPNNAKKTLTGKDIPEKYQSVVNSQLEGT